LKSGTNDEIIGMSSVYISLIISIYFPTRYRILNFQEEKGIGDLLYVLNGTDIKDGKDKIRKERNVTTHRYDYIPHCMLLNCVHVIGKPLFHQDHWFDRRIHVLIFGLFDKAVNTL
jgi:hypothetical protein